VPERLLHVRRHRAWDGSISKGLEFDVTLADIEALNHGAFSGEPDVTKLSFHAYAYCADKYVLLDAGSALGRNCGPLLISHRPIDRADGGARRAHHRDSGDVHDRQLSLRPRVSGGAQQDRSAVL
jgi:hypothetical protein